MKGRRLIIFLVLIVAVGWVFADVVQAITTRSSGPAGFGGTRRTRTPTIVTPPGGYAGQPVRVTWAQPQLFEFLA